MSKNIKWFYNIIDDKSLEEAINIIHEEEDEEFVRSLGLLSYKPVIYVANVAEDEVATADENPYVQAVKKIADAEGSQVVAICAEIEAQMAELEDDERAMFLEELGIEESGLDKLVKASYALLNLISFLTAGEDECRAWTIKKAAAWRPAARRAICAPKAKNTS